MMDDEIYFSEDTVGNGFRVVKGARCWCGDKLIEAPNFIQKGHKDKVVSCHDFCHDSFYFKDLEPGKQTKEI